jgi:hypothetical protein
MASSARRAHGKSAARMARPAAIVSQPGPGSASMTIPADNTPNPAMILKTRTFSCQSSNRTVRAREIRRTRAVFARCDSIAAGFPSTEITHRTIGHAAGAGSAACIFLGLVGLSRGDPNGTTHQDRTTQCLGNGVVCRMALHNRVLATRLLESPASDCVVALLRGRQVPLIVNRPQPASRKTFLRLPSRGGCIRYPPGVFFEPRIGQER